MTKKCIDRPIYKEIEMSTHENANVDSYMLNKQFSDYSIRKRLKYSELCLVIFFFPFLILVEREYYDIVVIRYYKYRYFGSLFI